MSEKFDVSSVVDLGNLANLHRDNYKKASPYPHVVLDNVFPTWVLAKILEEFPSIEDWPESWGKRNDPYQRKFGSRGRDLIGAFTNEFIDSLNSTIFLNFLSDLTGIKDLVADDELIGAGLHQIAKDGYLAIHADFNKAHHRDRRLNLLVYLNDNWDESWGGHFEMWNSKLTKKEKAVLPVYNRVVIFNTDETSYHGHPQPLRCPENRSRKSIALYYYTRGIREDKVSDKFKFEYVDTDWKSPSKKLKLG